MTLSFGSIVRTETRARKLGSGVGVRMEMEAGLESSLDLHIPLP
jgi:hypothetical protein